MTDVPWNLVLSVIGTVAALVVALSALMFVYDRRRSARYNEMHGRAELDLMRRSTETKMNELTERLLATEARWRDANHLLLDSQNYQQAGTDPRVDMTGFLKNAGLTAADLEQDPQLVFVLMPFHPDFQETFVAVKDICSNLGLRAVRGDEDYVPNDILSHVLKLLVRARLVIAVVDGRNPNVFYELGIAHALNKPTILVSADSSIQLPFDVRARKVVLAENPNALANLLGPEIARALVQR
jgi:hypothetical protein